MLLSYHILVLYNSAIQHTIGRYCRIVVLYSDRFSQTFSDVASSVLNGRVAIDIRQQTKAETVTVIGGVGKAVHQYAGWGGLESLSHTIIQLIVHNGAPVFGFRICHRLNICTDGYELIEHKHTYTYCIKAK